MWVHTKQACLSRPNPPRVFSTFAMTPFTLPVLGAEGCEQQRPTHTPAAARGTRELLASLVAYVLGFPGVAFNKQVLKVCCTRHQGI